MDISALRERHGDGVMTVTELNNYIKSQLELDRTLKSVSISGEISNFTRHTSGHLYFSLKDQSSQIKAIMFRSYAEKMPFSLENGMKVTVRGSVSVYLAGGTYSVYVYSVQPMGIGSLYLAYEQLKEKLYIEGLFDRDHKKSIPAFPKKIGVITSPTGAAVRDIINVTKRRYPIADIYIYPALVQGEGAEGSLISALDYLDASSLVDVIIIGRGGGSIEDLWAFNSERLARRIYSAETPIISAVGHETDFTICDFVSDHRAPTPSAAAELAVPDIRDIYLTLDKDFERCRKALKNKTESRRDLLERISGSRALLHPELICQKRKEELSRILEKACDGISRFTDNKRVSLSLLAQRLDALSPLSVLQRGYAVVRSGRGRVRSVKDLSIGDEISVRLTDGAVNATVSSTPKER